jgi:hypothetical protein
MTGATTYGRLRYEIHTIFAAHRCASARVDSRAPVVDSVLIAGKRPDLLDVAGVVEQHKNPLNVQHAPVQAGLCAEVAGDPLWRHAEGLQKSRGAHSPETSRRRSAGTAQVQIELAVGEPG